MQQRTDLSATLFLSEDYDGGELAIESDFGRVGYKLDAATWCSILPPACTA